MSTAADCIFCQIVSGDIPASTVYRDDSVIAFKDINPVAPAHILIVPVEHLEFLMGLDEGSAPLLGHMVLAADRIASEQGISEDGYRLVMNQGEDAGQVVDHLHVHLIGGRKLGALG